MFLQAHFLTSYHASLLNRDDAGLAKRLSFGGVERVRVSSQSQKRHWRMWMMERTNLPHAVRTRHFFNRIVKNSLVEAGVAEDLATKLTFELAREILTVARDRDAIDKETLAMKQPVLFGRPEADYFINLLTEAAKLEDEKEAVQFIKDEIKAGRQNFTVLLRQAGAADVTAGFEGALFGRFVTSDVLARIDAPVHVAHAFTTHALDTEVDFFTVVDDLSEAEETGAAHANDMELGAGLFYGYVAVDIPLLVSNLTGCQPQEWRQQNAEEARELLSLLVEAIAQVSPGAKLGATAPHAWAEYVALEVGDSQPRSLANAFLEPVRLGRNNGNPMAQSVTALAQYLDRLEGMYGSNGVDRYVSTLHPWPRKGEASMPLQEAIMASLDQLFSDQS